MGRARHSVAPRHRLKDVGSCRVVPTTRAHLAGTACRSLESLSSLPPAPGGQAGLGRHVPGALGNRCFSQRGALALRAAGLFGEGARCPAGPSQLCRCLPPLTLVSLVLTALLCAFVCVVLRVFSLITAEFPPPHKSCVGPVELGGGGYLAGIAGGQGPEPEEALRVWGAPLWGC